MSAPKALVVEDAADSALLLARVLKMCGYEADIAPDATTALRLAAEMVPDVLFLDIGLPEMDGYELARRLRALPSLAAAVIIAVTGFSPPSSQDEVRRLGFDHFITKPISIPDIKTLASELRQRPAGGRAATDGHGGPAGDGSAWAEARGP
jgi:CheY-like chemotaxis protein